MASNITREIKEKSKVSKEEWKEFTKTVWSIANVSHNEHPAVFPTEIPFRLIKLFSFFGETVLDPFGGTGTTASVAASLGRHGISVDQSSKYTKIANALYQKKHNPLIEGSARFIKGNAKNIPTLKDESTSLIVTSPPYWDKADYGDGEDNIGKRSSYSTFLDEMREVFAECFRVLEPGRKLCVITANVNQFTEHGLLTFPIAADLCVMLRELNFMMVNELVWSKDKTGGKWGSANGQRPIFGSYPYPPNFLFKNVHEYILIFSKPNGVERTGEKVRRYNEIMRMNEKETKASKATKTFAKGLLKRTGKSKK